MTEATEARLEQIIALSLRHDTHAGAQIRELAERALADERALEQPVDPRGRFLLNAYGRQCFEAGFAAGKAPETRRHYDDY